MGKVIFILGAGASAHLGFPTGAGLLASILQRLKRSKQLQETLYKQYGEQKIRAFVDQLERIDVDSIDEFLSVHRDESVQTIGRNLVAQEIAWAEHKSLSLPRRPTDWYRGFKRYLFERPIIADAKHFSFVTFNYDRSFQHFLYNSLTADPRFPKSQIAHLLGPNNLVHIHGHLGMPSWSEVNDAFDYGAFVPPSDKNSSGSIIPHETLSAAFEQLSPLSSRLFLPHSGYNVSGEVQRLFIDAALIVIVGFGFHRTNRAKLFLNEAATKGARILAITHNPTQSATKFLSTLPNLTQRNITTDQLFPDLVEQLDEVFGIDLERQ